MTMNRSEILCRLCVLKYFNFIMTFVFLLFSCRVVISVDFLKTYYEFAANFCTLRIICLYRRSCGTVILTFRNITLITTYEQKQTLFLPSYSVQ